MTCLVIGRIALLLVGQQHGLALGAHEHLVLGQLEVEHHHRLAVLAGGIQRRLVHQVGQVGAAEAGSPARQDAEIHVVVERDLAGVDAENLFAPADIGTRHHHPAVETARPQQGGIEHVGTVGRRNQDNAFVGFEAVHFNQ